MSRARAAAILVSPLSHARFLDVACHLTKFPDFVRAINSGEVDQPKLAELTNIHNTRTPAPTQEVGRGQHAPDQGVDLPGLDVIHAPHGILDLLLVSAHVHNEHLHTFTLQTSQMPAYAAPHRWPGACTNSVRTTQHLCI
jgi:hypothetical protein